MVEPFGGGSPCKINSSKNSPMSIRVNMPPKNIRSDRLFFLKRRKDVANAMAAKIIETLIIFDECYGSDASG